MGKVLIKVQEKDDMEEKVNFFLYVAKLEDSFYYKIIKLYYMKF